MYKMRKSKPLTYLEKGESSKIAELSDALNGAERRRLLDLGIVPGFEITYLYPSPLGEPKAFRILDSEIALRKEQTDNILIESEG